MKNEKNEKCIPFQGNPSPMNIFIPDLLTDEKLEDFSHISLNSIQIQSNYKNKLVFNAFGSNNSSQEIDLINFFN